jgi:ribosome-associated toxin RatA of RatAB toxin-antitoxin module
MRNVKVSARVAGDAGPCFDRISDFARYPELIDVIRDVAVYPADADGNERSDWAVYFRNGILRWSERDAPDRTALRITFEQIDGDFDYFAGQWTIAQAPDGPGSSVVTFDSDFDFGIPSLAGILDPVAERVFKETITGVLAGLFGQIEVLVPAGVC